MADIQPGHTYVPEEIVTHQNLNEHVSAALLLPGSISDKALKDPAELSDEMLVNDDGTLKKITIQQLKALIATEIPSSSLSAEARIPAGVILDFAGPDHTVPSGWFLCRGQAVSRVTYSALWAAIGGSYGIGDGSTTFNLPDCRGRVCAALDAGAGRIGDPALNVGLVGDALGSVGGLYYHTLTAAQMPSHNHSFSDYYQASDVVGGGGPIAFENDLHHTEVGAFTPNNTAHAGGNGAHNNVQPTIMVNKIIRYA